MTCVAGAKTKTKTEAWMAYDAASSTESEVILTSTAKGVRHAGGGLVGSAGSWSVINMIQSLKGSHCTPEDMALSLMALKESGIKIKGVELIMVTPGKPIISINSDGAIIELRSDFYAIGSGGFYALGYLEGCKTVGPEELKKAVKIAAKYDPGVAEPVTLITASAATPRPKKEKDLTPVSKSDKIV